MISYLIDLIILSALLFTSIRVTKVHRELRRLRDYHTEFCAAVEKTTESFDDMALLVHDLSANGPQLANMLGHKIDQARQVIAEIDARRPPQPRSRNDAPDDKRAGVEFPFMPLTTATQ